MDRSSRTRCCKVSKTRECTCASIVAPDTERDDRRKPRIEQLHQVSPAASMMIKQENNQVQRIDWSLLSDRLSPPEMGHHQMPVCRTLPTPIESHSIDPMQIECDLIRWWENDRFSADQMRAMGRDEARARSCNWEIWWSNDFIRGEIIHRERVQRKKKERKNRTEHEHITVDINHSFFV